LALNSGEEILVPHVEGVALRRTKIAGTVPTTNGVSPFI
jgi:hypothetical protein